jgi:hypothetical protein
MTASRAKLNVPLAADERLESAPPEDGCLSLGGMYAGGNVRSEVGGER